MNGGWCPIADDEYYEYGGHTAKSEEKMDGGRKCECPFGFAGERCKSTLSFSSAFFISLLGGHILFVFGLFVVY